MRVRGDGTLCAVCRRPNKLNEAFSIMIPGEPVFLAPGVRRILAGNPGLLTAAGTNTLAVLDPGPDDASHMGGILELAGPSTRWSIVTHTHCGLSPLAAAVARATGACLIGLPAPADGRQDASLSSGPGAATLDGLTAAVYDEVPVERHPWARFTPEAHLIKLAREGRVVERDGVWRVLHG